MKDTRDIINDKCNELWQKVTERLMDKDDDFTYSYTSYDNEDVLSGEFAWWLKGNAMFLQGQLYEHEGDLMIGDFKRICEVIGQTYIENLVGKKLVNNLILALKEEDYEINELFGGDK